MVSRSSTLEEPRPILLTGVVALLGHTFELTGQARQGELLDQRGLRLTEVVLEDELEYSKSGAASPYLVRNSLCAVPRVLDDLTCD